MYIIRRYVEKLNDTGKHKALKTLRYERSMCYFIEMPGITKPLNAPDINTKEPDIRRGCYVCYVNIYYRIASIEMFFFNLKSS